MMDADRRFFAETRTRVASDHALIAPDSHVRAALTGWSNAEAVVLINPAMGSAPRAPRFCQYLVHAQPGTQAGPAPAGVERLVYLLQGKATVHRKTIEQDGFAWLPPDVPHEVTTDSAATLLVFEKPYAPLANIDPPAAVFGTLATAPTEAFHGDDDAQLATLLPTDSGFDMAVNVFTFQTGTALPFVETHIMEHGLYMRSGQGIYRLAESWYPVRQGDVIWMAAYCPQWFVAMGKTPASYIYYKDINRHPLTP